MSAALSPDPAPADPPKPLAPGDMLDGRYRIDCYLGGGGMASVYRATHVVLEQAVAIKIISARIRELPGMAQRFLREAKAATHLKSEHVARVSDVGTMADGAPYMVMEYLDGRDLDAIVDSGEDLPVEEAVDYVLQACEALAEVHGLGIVHRDLKPANLFLTRGADGLPCVKLIDFGISRTDTPLSGKNLVALTQPDTVMGSPRYMAPEQMESASTADSRSDIYGIGAVLYELLTHAAPHEGETFLDIYAAATLAPPAAPSTLRAEVPAELDEVVLRCLRVDPNERYVDIAELALALAPFGPHGSIARADGIARILEAARARTRDGSASHEAVASTNDSRVHRRASSSAHMVKKRRLRRAMIATAVLVLAGVVFGGRALYSQGHASGVAGVGVAPLPPPATAPSASAPEVVTTQAAAAETAAAAAAAALAKANADVAPVAPSGAPVAVAPAPVAPQRTYPPRITTATAPAVDERSLFEDRK